MPAKKAGSAASSASGSDDEEPARRRDKYEQMLYVEHQKIPEFASKWDEFAEMWDDGTYSESDKLSIYYAVLLQTLRKVNAISEQMEHGPILLEMALVKFLSVWLKWGTEDREEPGKFNRGPSKKKAMDPTDIAIFGNNADFLQSITAIDDDKAVQYMKAAGLSVATVTRAAALASKGSKARGHEGARSGAAYWTDGLLSVLQTAVTGLAGMVVPPHRRRRDFPAGFCGAVWHEDWATWLPCGNGFASRYDRR
jgi:hypothetical protein